MDRNQFRKEYIDRVWRDLDNRTDRWASIKSATYAGRFPEPLFDYITSADDMFIDGYFVGTILVCAAILEVVLGDQIKHNLEYTDEKIRKLSLDDMIKKACETCLICQTEKDEFEKFKDLRNDLIHANVQELCERGPQVIDSCDNPINSPTFYLNSFKTPGIERDASDFI